MKRKEFTKSLFLIPLLSIPTILAAIEPRYTGGIYDDVKVIWDGKYGPTYHLIKNNKTETIVVKYIHDPKEGLIIIHKGKKLKEIKEYALNMDGIVSPKVRLEIFY